MYDLYRIKFCFFFFFFFFFLNKCYKHGALHTALHNDFPNIQARKSPLTSAISGLLSFLTNEGGLGRYIANCIDTTKKLEGRSTHVWVFSLPWSHNHFRFRAVETQWIKRWPADLAVRVQFPLEIPSVNGIPLHITFHYVSPPPHRPDLTEILLKRM